MAQPHRSHLQDTTHTVYGLLRAPITIPPSPKPKTWGSRISRRLLHGMGWKLHHQPVPQTHGLMVVYPHTSNWDFVMGLLYKWSTGMSFYFWIKDSATRIPLLGRWIRLVGGIGINRNAAHGVVENTIATMRQRSFLWLVITPEGTRSYTNGWRTGFYHVWKNSACPLGLAYIDYGKKELGVLDYVLSSGDMQADFAALAQYYAERSGHQQDQAAPVQPYQKNKANSK